MVNDGSYWVIRVNLWIINNGEWWCFCGEEWWIPRAVSATNSLLGQYKPCFGHQKSYPQEDGNKPYVRPCRYGQKMRAKRMFCIDTQYKHRYRHRRKIWIWYMLHMCMYTYIYYIHVFMLPPKTSVLIVCRGHGLWLKVVVNSAFFGLQRSTFVDDLSQFTVEGEAYFDHLPMSEEQSLPDLLVESW